MKKIKWLPLIISGIIIFLAVAVISLLIYINNQVKPIRGVQPLVQIDAQEPDSSKWGVNFPNQYATFLKTSANKTATTFGGSAKTDKLKADPRLVRLFAGNAFSIEYNDDRGHAFALIDVNESKRLSETTPGTCYSCKSADNPRLWSSLGMVKYDAMKFTELGKQITQPVGCANCHEANSMQLIVTNPALEEALKTQGKDWKTFTRQEMRSLVCANCHVEYFFAGDGKYLTFPWKYGTTIEAIDKFYEENQFIDWKHADSGANMVKAQHPDYELFTADSTHYKAGVACADCHMPYLRDGAAKFSSHDIKSPLSEANRTCASCHTDVDYVVARVKIIQSQVNQTMLASEEAIIAAIEAIKISAVASGADQALLEEARTLHRKAQLRWDFIAAENSMGFHNPGEALRILASATDLARQAQVKAILAANPK